MFCDICGQQIDFDKNGKLVHLTAGTFPFLDKHKPRLGESDRKRIHDRAKAKEDAEA